MIKYVGKKHLNSNWYKKIVLKKEENFLKVTATEDERLKNAVPLKTSTPYITETIDDLTDIEKIKELVSYFLRNNVICEINQENSYLSVKSTSNRELVLKLALKLEDNREILNMIVKKYVLDRDKFINSTTAKTIRIVGPHWRDAKIITKISSYGICKDEFGKKEAFVTYMCQGDKIIKYDQEFIDNYLNDQLCNASFCMYPTIRKIYYTIGVDDKMIFLPASLKDRYEDMVLKYYNEKFENRKKQVKLEGIR